MAVDCARQLKQHDVAFLSLWPWGVRTEHLLGFLDQNRLQSPVVSKKHTLCANPGVRI